MCNYLNQNVAIHKVPLVVGIVAFILTLVSSPVKMLEGGRYKRAKENIGYELKLRISTNIVDADENTAA